MCFEMRQIFAKQTPYLDKSQKGAVRKRFLKIENYGKLSETAQAAALHRSEKILHVKSSTSFKDDNIS